MAAAMSLSKCSPPLAGAGVPRETNRWVKISMSHPGATEFLPEKARVERRWDLFEIVQMTPGWSPFFYLECKSVWE